MRTISAPAAVTFLVVKVHAFRERFEADEQEKTGHHVGYNSCLIALKDKIRGAEAKAAVADLLT